MSENVCMFKQTYIYTSIEFVSSCVQLFATPWVAAQQASLSLTISQSLPKFMFIASMMLCRHLIP